MIRLYVNRGINLCFLSQSNFLSTANQYIMILKLVLGTQMNQHAKSSNNM